MKYKLNDLLGLDTFKNYCDKEYINGIRDAIKDGLSLEIIGPIVFSKELIHPIQFQELKDKVDTALYVYYTQKDLRNTIKQLMLPMGVPNNYNPIYHKNDPVSPKDYGMSKNKRKARK